MLTYGVLLQVPGTQASTSADKADDVVDLEAPVNVNTAVVGKVKPDERRTAPASEPAIPPESEVTTVTDNPPASEAADNLFSQSNTSAASVVNPLGSYGKPTLSGNPLASYGKEPVTRNHLGSYAKNPLGVYK